MMSTAGLAKFSEVSNTSATIPLTESIREPQPEKVLVDQCPISDLVMSAGSSAQDSQHFIIADGQND
jgi:hypothetical protein